MNGAGNGKGMKTGWALLLALALTAGGSAEAPAEGESEAREATAGATGQATAEEAGSLPAGDAAAAWLPAEGRTAGEGMDALIDYANARYAKAQEDKREGVELELLEDFEGFAAAWEGTDESIVALIQSATLAGMAEDFDRAERNLNRASELTDDAELEYEISRGLASIRVRPGGPAPDFALQTVDGRTIRIADFKGKVVLLDFWATWCAPCIAELPNLKKVYAENHPKGLEVVSISLDTEREYFDRFIKEQEMTWTHVYQEAQTGSEPVADLYGVVSIPRMILIGPDGLVLESQLRGEELNEAVAKAVAGGE